MRPLTHRALVVAVAGALALPAAASASGIAYQGDTLLIISRPR